MKIRKRNHASLEFEARCLIVFIVRTNADNQLLILTIVCYMELSD